MPRHAAEMPASQVGGDDEQIELDQKKWVTLFPKPRNPKGVHTNLLVIQMQPTRSGKRHSQLVRDSIVVKKIHHKHKKLLFC